MNIEKNFEIQESLKETDDVKVYKALEYISKKLVVLKLVRIGGVFPVSEYKTHLQHKNIVKCLEIKSKVLFQENEYHLSILEYVNATKFYQSLSKIKQKHFAFVHELLKPIAYLHDNNIIHGDIKSDNILVKQKNNQLFPVVMDYSTFLSRALIKS